MKILHLQTELNKSCGISKTIFLLIINSPEECTHAVFTLGGDNLERFRNFHIPLILSRNSKTLFGAILIFFEICRLIRKEKFDILHSHHRFFDLIASAIRRLMRIKTVTSVQSKVTGKRYLSYRADILIAPCRSIRDHLIKTFRIDENRITVIANFADENELKINPGNFNIKIRDCTKIILYIGRFSSEKGVDILIRAMHLVQLYFPDAILLMVGNGEAEPGIKSFISQKKINALIYESVSEAGPFYSLADIVVLPSRVDPFPLVMLESGIMRKPLVASNVDGIGEFILSGNDGILFNPGSLSGLTEAIKLLLSDEQLAAAMADRLSAKVRKYCTPEIIIQEYISVYKRLLNEEH